MYSNRNLTAQDSTVWLGAEFVLILVASSFSELVVVSSHKTHHSPASENTKQVPVNSSLPTRSFAMPPVAMLDDASNASFSVKEGIMKEPQALDRRKVQRRHSCVAFVGEHTIVEFDKADEEIKEEIWYSKDEYDIIKARNKLIVKMMKTGKFEETDEHSFRGLEHKLKKGFEERRSSKFNSLNAVLTEQDRQYSRGLRSADTIAEEYERVAYTSREAAVQTALKDAEECYVNDPTKLSLVVSDDDVSIISDLDTVFDDENETQQRKMRLRTMFGGLANRKKNKSQRRASM